MIAGSISRRWAKALFAIGEEQRNLLGLVKEVQRAAEVWEASEEFQVAVKNPLLDRKTREAVLDTVVRRLGITQMGKNFLKLLFDKSRMSELPAIAGELQKLSDRKDNRLRAQVTTVSPLAENDLTKLRVALQRSTGKTVVVSQIEDPEILGGIVTRVGDLMYDGSVRTQLARMKEGMLGRGR